MKTTTPDKNAQEKEEGNAQTQHMNGERGSALVIALMCLLALFTITLTATKVRVASARDVEDKNTQAAEEWDARAGAATVEASLITDIPAAYDSDLRAAQQAAMGYPLPAFDRPEVQPQASRPLRNSDGSAGSTPVAQCTSLLGNLNSWAASKSSIAESYAAGHGYGQDKARVAVFREFQRRQLVGAGNTEPAYILEYQIDAAVGSQGNARGRVRPSGTIMLGPSQPTCNTSVSLAANPTTITVGGSSTLTVTYSNANHVWLTDQTGAVVSGTDTTGLAETNAQQTLTFTVSPTDNTTYRAQAEGSGGCEAISADVTVVVNYPPPEVLRFDSTPACISLGQSTTLNFQVRYASTITITGGGVNKSFPGNAGTTPTSGTLPVTPSTDTTYTITATGRGGTASSTTSVTVKQPFSVDQFVSDISCVTPGATVNLTWATSNAEAVTITDSTTGIPVGVNPSGGTRAFTINSPTTFTLTASRTGCSGVETITRQLTINVTRVPTATFAANPTSIELGDITVLQWTTTDATSVTITPSPVAGSGMAGPQTVPASGTLTLTPTAVNESTGYTYTLTVTDAGCSTQTITKMAVVFVKPKFVPPPCPNVISFDGDSCVLPNQSATLKWNVADADFVDITGPGVNQTFPASPVGTGSLVVTPSSDATYTITARRTISCTPGSPPFPTTASFTVHVGQPPTISNLAAAPAVIDAGQTTRLTWNESANLASVRVMGSGGDPTTYNVPPGQRFLDVRPAATATYTVVVTGNDCKAQTASQSTTVTVAACPTVNSFFASSPTIIQGGSTTLQWNVSNASQVLLDGSPVGASGSRPVSPGTTTTYRLTAVSANGSCNVDRFVTVTVNSCPVPQITSFTASPPTVTIGGNQMVRLSWAINDTSGSPLTVTISPGVGTFSVPAGFVDISQPQATTIYTVTVTNGCGASASLPATVTATSCPAVGVSSFTASLLSGSCGSGLVRLQWATTGATSVSIPGVGSGLPPSGSADIPAPSATTNYSLTATNSCGSTAGATATLTCSLCSGVPGATDFQVGIGFKYSSGDPLSSGYPSGQPIIIDWKARNADPTSVQINGTPVTTYGERRDALPPGTYTWTITARNMDGSQTLSKSISATVNPPNAICSLVPDYFADRAAFNLGDSFTYSWDRKTYQNGTSQWWTDNPPNQPTVGAIEPASGSQTITPGWWGQGYPNRWGLFSYQYDVFNTSGDFCQQHAWFMIEADPPAGCGRIYTFDAGPQVVSQQNVPVRLNWQVDPGATLSIDQGVGNVTGKSFVDITAPAADTTYTLTAQWPSGCVQTMKARVIVGQKGWSAFIASPGRVSSVWQAATLNNNPDGSLTATVNLTGLGLGGAFGLTQSRVQLFGPDGTAFYDQMMSLTPDTFGGLTGTVSVPAGSVPQGANPVCRGPINMRADTQVSFTLFFSTETHILATDTRELDGFPVPGNMSTDGVSQYPAVSAGQQLRLLP